MQLFVIKTHPSLDRALEQAHVGAKRSNSTKCVVRQIPTTLTNPQQFHLFGLATVQRRLSLRDPQFQFKVKVKQGV